MMTSKENQKVSESDELSFLLDGIQSAIVDCGFKLSECGQELTNFSIGLSPKFKDSKIKDLEKLIERIELYQEVLVKAKEVYKNKSK